ncbi:S8 family peptidase [Clostridium tunisiense]|uniref:S8 family peptidase n=1 Tax=Clostridium tunisiense TaxID=219748 RepID=UPI00030963F5|nr:S8 family peptidase [Clostridium tunisiense]
MKDKDGGYARKEYKGHKEEADLLREREKTGAVKWEKTFNRELNHQEGTDTQKTPIEDLPPMPINKKSDKEYYLSEDYESYFIEYIGNIQEAIGKLDYAAVFLPGKFFAVVFVKKGMLNKLLQEVKEIVNVQSSFPYTLSELRVVNDTYDLKAIDKGTVALEGEGVVVGIISTGIDYLNPRFITNQGETRIEAIWDQSFQQGVPPVGFVQGTEFTKEKINEAIRAQAIGRNPYEIVSQRDEVGHGTAIAGIIGGRRLNENEEFKSLVPNCTFAIVKLNKVLNVVKEAAGIKDVDLEVYESIDLTAAIRYLAELQEKLKKPMVVYVAIGSNLGGHEGDTVSERYIDLFSQRRSFLVITNSGSQGDSNTHVSGNLTENEKTAVIRLQVDEKEIDLLLSVYTLRVDSFSFTIKSPTGEVSEPIEIPKENQFLSFTIGDTQVSIQFFVERQGLGEERGEILFKNIKGGVWEFNLTGEMITTGRYDSWLLQRELLEPGTRFLNPDPYITVMSPGTARNIITSAGYNQQTNTILPQSGRGFSRDGRVKPSVTNPAVNVLTTGLNDTLQVVSGMAVAGAILTGIGALIMEWGVVQGNDINMYPQKPRNFIIGATTKQEKLAYPNPEWGYGVVNIELLFQNLQKSISDRAYVKYKIKDNLFLIQEENEYREHYNLGQMYVNIPIEIYKRLGLQPKVR